MVHALHTGDPNDIAEALALLKSNEVEEVEDPPVSLSQDDEDEEFDLSDRCWRDGIENIWLTDFPPPAGFTGYESRPFDEDKDKDRYERACTPEEVAVLEGDEARAATAERAEEEALRDAWFACLKDEANPSRHAELDSASIDTAEGNSGTPDLTNRDPGEDEAAPPTATRTR